ncbi:flagellin [Devosia sp. LjRoot16]|uniref:flagellin N-terminal helical domain-containing protein n=1 Tax=Devosia sp. LjRoot16 TaxID=3342271 RepID=UPI003ED13E44
MADVNLSKAVRSNLLSLQSTASSMAKTQERLATGLKVNSALDNPTNFFTAASLNSRASDMASLLDSMSNGIKTIEAADNGLSSITKTVESMQSTLRQARQDKSFKTGSFAIDTAAVGTSAVKTLSFEGGAVGSTAVSVNLNTTGAGSAATAGTFTSTANFAATTITDAADSVSFQIAVDGGTATTVTIDQTTLAAVGNNDDTLDDVAEFNELLTNAGVTGVTASVDGSGKLVLTSATTGTNSSVAISSFTETDADNNTTVTGVGVNGGASAAGAAATAAGAVKTVDALVSEINGNTSLKDKVRASNDNGKLRIENLSTEELTVTGVASDGEIDGSTAETAIGGNEVRKNLAKQFNELRDQLDKLADDASFNGINLLRGDKLKLTFNETGTSTIDIQAKDSDGDATSINNTTLGITSVADKDLDSDASIDAKLGKLGDALGTLRSQSSAFGSNLSIVQNRQDFTKNMINTLETGAANLTLADTNEEAANLLALQTRQQLSSTALSMASQADQAVLRLF